MDKKVDLVFFRMFIFILGVLWVFFSFFRVLSREKLVLVNALFYIVLLVFRDEYFKLFYKIVFWIIVGVFFRIFDEYFFFRYGSVLNLGFINSRRVD